MRRERKHAGGFILIPVVVAIAIIGVLAFYSANQSAIDVNATGSELETTRADYVAQAGLQHALRQAAQQGCGPYTDLMNVPIGNDKYGTSLTTTLGATTAHTISVDQDSWIRDDNPSATHPSDDKLHFRSDGVIERPVYRYDLSKIPAQASVISAAAYFYVNKDHAEGPVDIHALTSDWTEANASWDVLGDAMDTRVQATIPTQPTSGVWVSVNVTALVQAWVNGQANFGITLNSLGDGAHGEYASRESTNPSYLEVVTGTLTSSQAALKAVGTLDNGLTRSLFRNDVNLQQAPAQFVHWQHDANLAVDTYIWETNPTTNYGNDDEVWVSRSSNNSSRSLFRFAVESLPRGAKIHSATLSLYHESGSDADVPVTAHRIEKSWEEDEATWRRRKSGVTWDTDGGDFDAAIVSTTLVGPASNVRYEWDLTALVRGWVDGVYDNYGLALATDMNGTFGERFYSSDEPTYARLPRLTIRYTCGCGTVCSTLQGSGRIALIGDDAAPDSDDTVKIATLESWGYDVDFYEDLDSDLINWNNYDLAYVSETSISGDVAADLEGLTLGVINEEPKLYDNLQMASGDTEHVGATITLTDNAHFITSVFPPGDLTIYDRAMEILSANNPHADGLQILGEFNGEGAITVIDQGADTLAGPAAGRRVNLPFGQHANAGFDWQHMNHNGFLLLQRAIEWALGNDAGTIGNVLLVVGNAGSPSSKDSGRRTLIEGWGYSVTLIDDGTSQANFDTAAAANDVVYVSGTIGGGALADKLTKSPSPIVNEFAGKLDNFGFSSGTGNTVTSNGFTATNTLQYIGAPFDGAAVTHFNSNLVMPVVSNTIAPGIIGSASLGTLTTALPTLDVGALRWDNDPSPGRRVHLPFGAAEVSQLTDDGQTLLRRALEWAAGSSLDLGPIAHWKLDETSGGTALDSAGGHHGTLANGPVWTPAVINGGLAYDGNDDAIVVPHSDSLSLTEAMTFSAWIKSDAFGVSGPYDLVVSKGTVATSYAYYFGALNDEIIFGFSADGSYREFVTPGLNLATGTWHHIAATFDNNTGNVRLYHNGVEVLAATTVYEPSATTHNLYVGSSEDGADWDGALDDVRIYDRELSASEIADIAVKPPQLLLVVGDPAALTLHDHDRRNRIEEWGYNVSLIDDNASQTEFDDAVSSTDAIYVRSSISWSTLGSKLDDADKGLLNETVNLIDDFGFAGSFSFYDSTGYSSTNASHFITSPYSGAAVTTFSITNRMYVPSGTLAPGLVTVGSPNGGPFAAAGLATLESGASMHGGGQAPGRRVHLPMSGISTSDMTDDGREILLRAIEWAAGSGSGGNPIGGGGGDTPPVLEEFTDVGAANNTTSLNIPTPGGTSSGDLLIAALVTDGDSGTSFNPPAGWTPVSMGTNANGRVSLGVWWKIASAAEPTDYAFTWSGREKAYGWIMRFTGHDAGSPVLFDNGALTSDSTSTPICQRLITPVDNMLVLRLGAFDDDDINSGVPGLDGHTAINMGASGGTSGNVSGGSGYTNQATAGDTDLAQFELTGNEEMRTVTLGIRPAP